MIKYLVLSPHLDDGVLSCGEFVRSKIDEGNDVTIVTVFSGYPEKTELSDAAKKYHSDCFLSDDAMEYRKEEDIKACKILGCKYKHLDFYECLYRKNGNGDYIYPDIEDIYHLEDDDNVYIEKFSPVILDIIKDYDYILAPLGMGNHADHLLLNEIMKNIARTTKYKIMFYEEVPYICSIYDSGKKVDVSGMKPVVFEIKEKSWLLKLQAVLSYRSQLHILWENENERIKQLNLISSSYKFKHGIRFWELEE